MILLHPGLQPGWSLFLCSFHFPLIEPTIRIRWVQQAIRIVVEQHGEGGKLDTAVVLAIGRTDDGDLFTGCGELAFHEGGIAVEDCLLEGVESSGGVLEEGPSVSPCVWGGDGRRRYMGSTTG